VVLDQDQGTVVVLDQDQGTVVVLDQDQEIVVDLDQGNPVDSTDLQMNHPIHQNSSTIIKFSINLKKIYQSINPKGFYNGSIKLKTNI
jgi:hypothetical protein